MMVRYAGGQMHGRQVDADMLCHPQIIVSFPTGPDEIYVRWRWFEFEGIGEGEIVYVCTRLTEEQIIVYAREALRPH